MRSSADLRDVLFQEIDSLRSGNSTPQRSRAVAALANAILQSVFAEIDFHKAAPKGSSLPPIPLAAPAAESLSPRVKKAA
jgi:hypothetical protein